MEIKRVDSQKFAASFGRINVFNTADFAQLNAGKCSQVHYLLFIDTKVRLGMILGERDQRLCSPFSSPFGGFVYNEEPRLEVLREAVDLLAEYLNASDCCEMTVTLPPMVYAQSFMAKVVAMFGRSQFELSHTDLNYHYDLSRFDNCEDYLSRNARKNLNRAKTVPFEFVRLNARDDAQVARAYEAIKTNRESRGYPLRMSLDDVLRTIRIIDADFFVLTLDGVDVAAAQVFHVADGIAQVVYWGDVPGYGEMRPMNMLSYCLFEHYRNNGIKVLDIGPSTEHGEPNYGLCEFKENLGCEISLKHTFTLSI